MAKTTSRWSRSALAQGIVGKVDREKRIIHGCSLVTRGEALGHGFWLDSAFVDETVKSGQAACPAGAKARFTHPGLCSDGMGKYLGRWRNVRRDGDCARADLHLAESASKSPDGDLAEYVMSMAEEDPEAFGASITFEHDLEAEEKFTAEHSEFDKEAGRVVFKSPDPGNERHLEHARLKQLRTADVVDDPAANPGGLFSRGSELAQRAERFLDWALLGQGEGAELEPAFGISADRAREFIQSYLDRRSVRLSPAPAAPGASASKEDSMAGDKDKAAPDAAALQAEAQKAGVEEGRKAVRGELEAMLAAFPKDRAFALESFAKGLSVEQAKAVQAEALAAKVEQLEKENGELKSKQTPPPPPAGKAINFSEVGAAGNDFLSVAKARATEKGIELGAAMAQLAAEQPELHAKYLAGGK